MLQCFQWFLLPFRWLNEICSAEQKVTYEKCQFAFWMEKKILWKQNMSSPHIAYPFYIDSVINNTSYITIPLRSVVVYPKLSSKQNVIISMGFTDLLRCHRIWCTYKALMNHWFDYYFCVCELVCGLLYEGIQSDVSFIIFQWLFIEWVTDSIFF